MTKSNELKKTNESSRKNLKNKAKKASFNISTMDKFGSRSTSRYGSMNSLMLRQDGASLQELAEMLIQKFNITKDKAVNNAKDHLKTLSKKEFLLIAEDNGEQVFFLE